MQGCLKSELKTMKFQTKCMQDDIDALQSQVSSNRATKMRRRRFNGRAAVENLLTIPAKAAHSFH